MASCVFCDIVAGVVKAFVVYDDPQTLAFLDRAPLLPGHVLVVPKVHIPTLGDLPAEQVGPYFQVVQRLAAAVEQALQAEGSFVAANIRISQSVPHLHVHVVPRWQKDGLFSTKLIWKRSPYKDEAERRTAQAKIRRAIEEISGEEV